MVRTAFVPKLNRMYQRIRFGAKFSSSCNCIIFKSVTDIKTQNLIQFNVA